MEGCSWENPQTKWEICHIMEELDVRIEMLLLNGRIGGFIYEPWPNGFSNDTLISLHCKFQFSRVWLCGYGSKAILFMAEVHIKIAEVYDPSSPQGRGLREVSKCLSCCSSKESQKPLLPMISMASLLQSWKKTRKKRHKAPVQDGRFSGDTMEKSCG